MSNDLDTASKLLAKLEDNTDLVPPDPRWTLTLALRHVVAHLRSKNVTPAPPPSPSEENGGEASDEEPSPRNPSKHPDQRDGQCGMVSHDEAKDIALAYIDKAFNNPERPGRVRIRHTIPANYRDNTDLRLMAYIDQQRHQASADAATIAGLLGRIFKLRGAVSLLADGADSTKREHARLTLKSDDDAAARSPEPGGRK